MFRIRRLYALQTDADRRTMDGVSAVFARAFDYDPTGTFVVTTRGMRRVGERIGALGLPTLIVQEGGYSAHNLRRGARAFFDGSMSGL